LAGRSLSILPGPVRGADDRQWAQSTVDRFSGIGVRQVFTHGVYPDLLRARSSGLHVGDVTVVGQAQRSTTLAPQATPPGVPAVLQGTAGSTGTPRTAMLSPEAVLNNVTALLQHTGVDATDDIGLTWLP
ncbi:long-chain fatty acid--CoA ligase, partial [Mycobacterium sp. ITM-2017-0098]